MAKKIILLLIAIVTALTCFAGISVSAAEIDYAFYVKGSGNKAVKTIEELVACFEDEDGTSHATYDGNTLYLNSSVVLTTPIVISDGTYSIDGQGCTIYRGFDGGALFGLDGTTTSPSLYFGVNLSDGEEWDGTRDGVNIILDGNIDEYKNNSLGIVAVKGQARFSARGKVIFKNSGSEIGSVVYAESVLDNSSDNTLRSPSVAMFNTLVTGCETTEGGAIYLNCESDASQVILEKVTFKSNKSSTAALSGYGSCLRAEGGTTTITSCVFDSCEANFGGALYVNGKMTVTGSSFTYNSATENGGAIYLSDKADAVFDANTVSNNTAGKSGGAISNGGELTIKGVSYVMDNTAGENGGGVYNTGTLRIEEVNLVSNTAAKLGGGVFCAHDTSKLIMSGGEIKTNKAKYAAGVYCSGELNMTGGGIAKNKGEAPQVVLKRDSVIAANALISGNDVVALCRTEKSDGSYYYPHVDVNAKLRDGVSIKIGLYSEKTDSDGQVTKYKNITTNSARIYECKVDIEEHTKGCFDVQSRGLLSYSLLKDGTVSVRFIFLPLWAWLLIALGALAVVCVIFRKRIINLVLSLKNKLKKKKAPIVHHKKRK